MRILIVSISLANVYCSADDAHATLLAELDREAPRTRRTLERVPRDRDDWRPHPKSMPLARLAGLVASMPSWITMIIEQDELNLTPAAGQGHYQQPSIETLGRCTTDTS